MKCYTLNFDDAEIYVYHCIAIWFSVISSPEQCPEAVHRRAPITYLLPLRFHAVVPFILDRLKS